MIRVLALVLLFCLPFAAQAQELNRKLDALGARPCEDVHLECVTLDVPLNHYGNDPSRTIAVTFAVHLAGYEPLGTILLAVGGPGYSGVTTGGDYADAFDSALLDYYNIIFFDQRGIGLSDGLGCEAPQAVFDAAELPLDDPETALTRVRTYVTDCLGDIGNPALLPHMATDQAIRDAELFRQALGSPKLWLYGESYGTQFAQQYAIAFPDAVMGVILDGTVDLTLDLKGFNETFVAASSDLLARILAACDSVPGCAGDMVTGAATDYAALRERLKDGPVPVTFFRGDGTSIERPFSSALLEVVVLNMLYEPIDRADFLRALAQSARGNDRGLLDLADWYLGIDPQSGETLPDPGWFGAAYYAITCADYPDESGADPDAAARRILSEVAETARDWPDFPTNLAVDRLVCAYWPAHGPANRPAPFAGSPVWPTLILNADSDPITPVTMARAVEAGAENASLVIMRGGPHVIYARGLTCPDEIMLRFLGGETPDARIQYCDQDLVEDYRSLTLVTEADRNDPLAIGAAISAELELNYDLLSWDGNGTFATGCASGGLFRATNLRGAESYVFEDCAFWPGISVTGIGSLATGGSGDAGLWLNVTVSGPSSGTIAYVENDTTDARRVSGTWNGQPITD